MSTASALAMIFAVGASTYLFRSGVILFVGNRPIPARFELALRNVAPAVLSALVVTVMAGDNGVDGIALSEVAGVAGGGLAAKLSNNLMVGLVVGMAAFWALNWA